MKIDKIINNNVVSALDEYGKEIIVTGRGIGFQKKSGQEIKEAQIEKIFRLESPDVLERFKTLLADMPLESIQISAEIIAYAKEVLHQQLNQSIYVTLTDHIDFALSRLEQGMLFENALYSEIRRFYPAEFGVGKYALQLIRQRAGIQLPEDEAASIAFHLVNAEFGMKISQTQELTQIVARLTEMVNEVYPLQEDSIHTDRLITNLKFLLCRLFLHQPAKTGSDPVFKEFIRSHCPGEYELAGRMEDYIQSVSSCRMTEEERIYLTIQLKYTIHIYAE